MLYTYLTECLSVNYLQPFLRTLISFLKAWRSLIRVTFIFGFNLCWVEEKSWKCCYHFLPDNEKIHLLNAKKKRAEKKRLIFVCWSLVRHHCKLDLSKRNVWKYYSTFCKMNIFLIERVTSYLLKSSYVCKIAPVR